MINNYLCVWEHYLVSLYRINSLADIPIIGAMISITVVNYIMRIWKSDVLALTGRRIGQRFEEIHHNTASLGSAQTSLRECRYGWPSFQEM